MLALLNKTEIESLQTPYSSSLLLVRPENFARVINRKS
jgi:hypothetical protein